MKKISIATTAVAALTLFSFTAMATDKIKVVASFSVLGDMVKHVVGEFAEVTEIVGADADAHIYSPSAGDAKAVANAEVIFVNGLGFETWSKKLIDNSGSKADVFVVTEGVKVLKVAGELDPHAWHSTANGVIYVDNIANAMSQVDPQNAKAYKVNAKVYSERLLAIHEDALAQIARLPKEARTVVTAHDAFGYLAKAYGLRFLAPVGISTEAQPSALELANLIEQLKQEKVKALFIENAISPALMEQISRETGIEISGRLYSDSLSQRGGPATTYEAMMRYNLNILIQALSR